MEFGLLAAAVGALTAAGIVVVWQQRKRSILPDRPFDRILGAVLVGLFVGRVAEMLLLGINPLTDPGQILLVRGGVSTVAAAVAATSTLLVTLRANLARLDGLAPALVGGLGAWHLGCLVRASCLGAVTALPWGWPLPGSDLSRHPVELYTALLLIAATIWLLRGNSAQGQKAALAMAAMAGSRLVTEPLRLRIGDGLWPFYLGATVAGLAVAYWLRTTSRARSIPAKKSAEV